MANLKEWQIKENDIDWYCLVNGHPTHIASMGGMLPDQFRDSEQLSSNQITVAQIEPYADVKLNIEAIRSQVGQGYEYLHDQNIREAVENAFRNHPGFVYLKKHKLAVRLFASTFVEKARRGFRSFARLEGEEDNVYVLIAEPVTPTDYYSDNLKLEPLECELKDNGKRIVIRLKDRKDQ